MEHYQASDGFYCLLQGVRHFVRTREILSEAQELTAFTGGYETPHPVTTPVVPSSYSSQHKQSAVLLLHGFMQDSRIWEPVRETLEKTHAVYALDFAGCGLSDATTNPLLYRFEGIVQIVHELMEFLASYHGAVHVMGYSFGGRVALLYAQEHQQYVLSLVLESSGVGLLTPEERAALNAKDAALVERIQRFSPNEFVNYWESLPLFLSQQHLSQTHKQMLREMRLTCNTQSLAAYVQGSGQHAMPYINEITRAFRIPTLYLAGLEDAKYCAQARMLAVNNKAKCAFLPGGHNLHWERPADWLSHVQPFLQLVERSF